MKMGGALEGIKVVAFEWVAIGPMTTSSLGDQGATVVKVESHVRPDPLRFVGPFKEGFAHPDYSGFFTHHNTSKYSVTIDLKRAGGKDLALKLIKWADVVLENMTPKTMERLELGYKAIRSINPKIIYVSLSLQGQSGPHYMSAGLGQMAGALAGCYHLSGWPDRPPSPPHGAYTDYITPRFAAATIMAALLYRKRTGKGQYIDMSVLETTACFHALPVIDYVINGRVWNRMGNRHPSACPHGAFRCRGGDRWVAIAVFAEKEWHALCKVMRHPEWTKDPRFSTFWERKKNENELERLIETWTMEYTAEQVELLMQGAGVSANVVESTADLFSDPQLNFRRTFRWLDHKVMGPILHTGPAFHLSKTPDTQFAPPALGEHNEFVLKEILKLTDDEISDLYAEKVITTEADLPF